MTATSAQLLISLASLGVALFTIAIMIRRDLVRRFWYQFLQICCGAAAAMLLWMLVGHVRPAVYTQIYWVRQAIITAVNFVVVYYYWRTAFIRYRGLHRLCIASMLGTLGVEVIVLLFTSSSISAPGTTPTSFQVPNWLQAYFILLNRSAGFVLAGLLWLFFGILALLHVETSRTLRNLALGMFVIQINHVVLDSWVYVYGNSTEIVYLRAIVGFFVTSLWCYSMVKAREEAVETAPLLAPIASPEEVERRMNALNLALLRMTGSPDSK